MGIYNNEIAKKLPKNGTSANKKRSEIIDTNEILTSKKSMPPQLKKYWNNRYNLFHKFDNGIKLSYELWYSVTPESISIYVAKFIKHCCPTANKVLDLFCGGGGNTIHFLKLFDKVVSIDWNQVNLDCTRNNVNVYFESEVLKEKTFEVVLCDWGYSLTKDSEDSSEEARIEWENTQEVTKKLRNGGSLEVDVVFGSPPWGGPEYNQLESFDLNDLKPLNLKDLLNSLKLISDRIVLFLPRNSDLDQLKQITEQVFGSGASVRVTKVYLYNGLKGMLCFWGQEFCDYQRSE